MRIISPAGLTIKSSLTLKTFQQKQKPLRLKF